MNNRRSIVIGIVTVVAAPLLFFSFPIIVNSSAEIYLKTKIFTEVLIHISDEYVDDIDTDMLLDKAINAMIEELDPHSNFVPPSAYGSMTDRFLGYQGIGIQFRMINDKITVMRVLRDGPSERASLMLGDRIIKIEGKDVIGIDQNKVPTMLKGPTGTKVMVTIERPGVDEPFDVVITRGQAFLESIKYYIMLDEKTGYIKLDLFSRTTEMELERVLRRLEGQDMQRLVLDLRRNTGGLLPQAVGVTDKFLTGNKLIVKTKGRHPTANGEYNSTDKSTDVLIPMIILIDGLSASASEIVSGALQDWDRALIIGKTSFGKGLVQSQTEFEDHSALLLTIGRWYTPLGRLIQKEYENKTRQQYRQDAYSDSLNVARNQDINRPIFTTPMGRTVYGGGGILPDVELELTLIATDFGHTLRNALNKAPFFNYAQQYALKNPDKWRDIEHFLREYRLEGAELENFKKFLRERDFDVNEQDWNEDTIKELELWTRSYIGEFLWGDEGRIRAFAVDDNVLWESLAYFPEAEKLSKN